VKQKEHNVITMNLCWLRKPAGKRRRWTKRTYVE